METLRTFIALDMPAAIKAAIAEYVQPLKALHGRVSWVKPENLHLTLKFLGDTPVNRIDEIAAALQELAAASTAFSATVAGAGAFPNGEKPRVLWVGLDEPAGTLVKLAQAIDERMHRLGFAKESRAFAPHLTIGRVKDARIPEVIRALQAKPFVAMPAPFHEIIFMQSELNRAGAIYTPLRKLALSRNW